MNCYGSKKLVFDDPISVGEDEKSEILKKLFLGDQGAKTRKLTSLENLVEIKNSGIAGYQYCIYKNKNLSDG